VVLLLAAAVIPLSVLVHQSVPANAMQLITGLPLGVVDFIVARRQPRNPIGWLLLAVPVGVLIILNAVAYAVQVYRSGFRLPLGPVAVFLAFAYIPVLFVALPPVFLLFPDGELPSPRWRRVLRSYLAIARPSRHRRSVRQHGLGGPIPAHFNYRCWRSGWCSLGVWC
jgi:hypothetical protein